MNLNLILEGLTATSEYKSLIRTFRESLHHKAAPLPYLITGLCEGASYAFYAALIREVKALTGAPLLILLPEEKEANRLSEFLRGCGIHAPFYQLRDFNYYNITASHDFEYERLRVLEAVLDESADAVLATPDAALQYTIPAARLKEYNRTIDFNSIIDPTALAEALIACGYTRCDMVQGAGQFSIRGGVIDIFPPHGSFFDSDGSFTEEAPVRMELFGDEVDRIVLFDPLTQRITRNIEGFKIFPSRELLPGTKEKEAVRRQIDKLLRNATTVEAQKELTSELTALDTDGDAPFLDRFISLVYPEKECLLDYFKSGSAIVLNETSKLKARAQNGEWQTAESVTHLIENGLISADFAEYFKNYTDLLTETEKRQTFVLNSFATSLPGRRLGGLFTFDTKHTIGENSSFEQLKEDLDGYVSAGYRALILCDSETEARGILRAVFDAGYSAFDASEVGLTNFAPKTVGVLSETFIGGFESESARFALILFSSGGAVSKKAAANFLKRRGKKYSAGEKILSYADLEIGDYVVHASYGIGQYLGIENMTLDGISRDYIGIQYAGTDRLFLPVDQLDLVSKYIGAGSADGSVKLSKMGGGEWTRARSRAKTSAKSMAKELIELYARRQRTEGFAFAPDDALTREFDTAFEYEETQAQINAITDIKSDMEKPYPMDRLLCGDVGYGKTEVALRAAFKAIENGKQVAILVPTTILAFQHYRTILSRFRGFPVHAEMLSRFRTPTQQAQILRGVKRGDVDILVGTHRMISKDVEFRDLGLLIVDEEQRFGVAQKEKLKQFAPNVDVLTLTATPIPRTLNMAMSGIRDMSVLDEAPTNRTPVQSYVLEYDEAVIFEAIRRELRRGGQVFYLYNRVESIYTVASRLTRAFPDAAIAVAHGQMDRDQIEDIWDSLTKGEIDILVTTTIIETGIDVPNANTLIIENADKMGLSQLHQIRGRVGRSNRRAYAYFTYRRGKSLTEIADKRLSAIRDFAEFGAGFKIALRDLEIRGAGNLLGAEQHGHLEAIGYDLYIKLLNEAVLEEKGITPEEKKECTLDIRLDAFLPKRYVSSQAQRMDMYKKIAHIENDDDFDDICDELCDRFGDIPSAALNLLRVALLKALASKCGITKVTEAPGELRFLPEKVELPIWGAVAAEYPNTLKLVVSGTTPYVCLKLKRGENSADAGCELMKKYIQKSNKNG